MTDAPTVTLRDLEAADRERLFEWRNRPDVAAWMYSDHAITPAKHEAWFAAAPADPRRRYWIIEVDGWPVGLANLADLSPTDRRTSWAYYLADPSLRGKGVGAYVEFWVIEQVFGPMALNKLCCEVLAGNEAVWRLHESFGFVRESLLRQQVWKQGQPLDVIGLGLLASDWVVRRPESARRLREKGYDVTG